jgi:hypothetical protein
MCPLSDFLQQSLLDVHLSGQHAEPQLRQVLPSAASSSTFFQQEFVSFGIVRISIISDLDRHLSFIQCRTPCHPFTTSSCTISLDMNMTL